MKKHIALAQKMGISDDDVKSVLDLALFIKNQASSHVDRVTERIGNNESSMDNPEDSGGCIHDNSKWEPAGSNKTETDAATVRVVEDDCGCSGEH